MKYKISDMTAIRNINGEVVCHNIKTDKFLCFNETATYLITLISDNAPISFDEIIENLKSNFHDIDESVIGDINNFIQQLVDLEVFEKIE